MPEVVATDASHGRLANRPRLVHGRIALVPRTALAAAPDPSRLLVGESDYP